ncbi:molybdopterin cofactor-binding domain-containing protein [Novosphingobium sp. PASSN1]|uniref:xanthine dehydrogenase family protein molybdopterin-binding subunit n=1 Tax=Novosphingobium sp. PASSN1 TaxID=2015561 RepID=UPI000BD9EC31|nr:molybdopterin cofactor-binding domain-containing protein [Novosphingobium sp. PASSN1]OYU34151.1 MAG: xanthine dehydrogenase [Novosphingobium sp. PASSN1]
MRLSRRGLLIGAGGAGALLALFALAPRRYASALVAGPGEHVFDSFIRLAADGAISVAVPVCEMGQGITTLMAQIVAVELGADWKRVGVEPAPASPVYGDPVLAARWAPLWQPRLLPALADSPDDWLARVHAEREPLMITAEGTALAAFEAPLRAAAAGLRAMLMQAAAAKWNVAWETCDTAGHFVVNGKQRIAFAALIADAVAYDPPDPPALRAEPAKERPGQFPDGARARFPRLDLPVKADGSFVFAGDVRVPGMVHAAIVHGPQGDTVLSTYDGKAASKVPGVVGVVRAKRWVAVAAKTWHAAHKAVLAMEPRFRAAGRIADSSALDARIDTALRKGAGTRVMAEGDPDALLAKPSLTARYDIEPALHAPLETATATARLTGDRLELWLATQAPELVRRQAARAAGLSRRNVVVYAMHAGGSFDARLDARIAVEAVLIAKALGRPVQLMWSRWEESLAGYPRTPLSALLSASIGPDKRQLLGWRTRLALPATAIEAGARLLDGMDAPDAQATAQGRADPLACAGAMPLYAIPERAVDHVPVALPLPTARYRGNAHAYGAFITESFIDECAHFGGAEPLSYRIGMLTGQPRLAACLVGAARMAMWGGGADASGQGIACHRMDLAAPEGLRSGFIAVVATARQDEGAIRVDQLSAWVDLGRIVNMDIARQQVEGGMLFALAQAVGGSTGYAAGLPTAGRLAQLGLPLLADCPKVDIAFAESDEHPFDPGELATTAVAPAIANALFSATGLRFRRLPLLSEGL